MSPFPIRPRRFRPPFSLWRSPGAALLALGLFLRWDAGGRSFLQNDFGNTLSYGGASTSLAPIGIIAAAVVGALLARNQSTRAVGAGFSSEPASRA